MTVVPLRRSQPDAAPNVAVHPVNRRQAAKSATRAKVLDAAHFLFVNVGYYGTGMRDIAARIGMSTGAVNATAEGKEALWRAALNGPPPSQQLAEEVALALALRPGWCWLIRYTGSSYKASINHPAYTPFSPNNRIYFGEGDSPASALREARLNAERYDSPEGRA